MPAMATNGVDEDGFFTCAVSVQHKKHDQETGSNYSGDESGRKVVWPSNQPKLVKQAVDTNKTFHNTFKQAQKSTEEEMKTGFNRVSRSRSRSKNIMERARSFERAGAESRGNSRPVSRNGSFRNRSPSASRNNVDEMWSNQLERPGSRTDVDSRRFADIGRVNTLDWEERIHGSMDNLATKTPPMKRREMNLGRNDEERTMATKTPEPPPPPSRSYQNTRPEESFPPPPCSSDTRSKLSEESVNLLSEENKENIVKQWVESTSQSTGDINRELERFAYDIAESVVSTLEKNTERKESWNMTSTSSNQSTSAHQVESSSGLFHAVPVHTSQELHGPVYVQDQPRRVGMTFQQEERRREELLRQEELKQEELRRMKIQAEQRERQEEEIRVIEERRRQEDEKRRMEEERRRKQEDKQRREEQKKREEEERKKQELLRFEKLKREEEAMRQEEIRLEQEMRKQYELQQQQLLAEQRVKEQQMREQQIKEQQMREQQMLEQQMREQQMREQQMMEQQMKEQQMREQQMREQQMMEQQMREQQMREQQMREQQMREQQIREQQIRERQLMEQQMREQDILMKKDEEKDPNVRSHIPKITATSTFDHSQDRSSSAQRQDDHLGKVRTGQVHEKRNFWIRSTSADRVNGQTLSPAPRRRRMEGWNPRQKENEDPESRPGSSLGQANTGSVKNISSGFLSKSKSSAAVMQDGERGRPRNKAIPANSWTKEKYDQQTNQNFLKSQEVKTNKVNDTISTWGKHEQPTSGRTTPAPSRNIGQVFAENKVAKVENEKTANSWRTKTPEPSVKLMNVSVEKAAGSNQSIRFSENAHAQMASYVQEGKSTQQTITMKQEMTSTSAACSTGPAQPPPTPERNQSFGGKSTDIKQKVETQNTFKESQILHRETDVHSKPNQEHGVPSNKNSVPQQDRNQNAPSSLQNSTSAQSINSIVSNCSSGALPLPVKHLWFDELENMSAASLSLPEGVLSPTGTGVTPVPVVAHWFTHSDFDEKLSRNKNQNPQTNSKNEEKFVVDDIDTRSVKSDTTVIENLTSEYKNQEEESETTTVQYNHSQHQAHNMSFAGQTKAQVAASEQAQALVMASAPAPIRTPVLAPATVPAPAPAPALAPVPAPVLSPAPVRNQSPDPAPLMDPTPVLSPAPVRDQIMTPTPKKPVPSSKPILHSKSTLNSVATKVQEPKVPNSTPASELDTILTYCTEQGFSSSSAYTSAQGLESSLVQDTAAVQTSSSVLGTQSDPLSAHDEGAGVIIVPQSPAEIRKKFQQQDSFEKSFQRSSEFELSKEFRAGVKGKVRESKESFLKKSNSGKIFEGKELRDLELESIKLHRSDSRNFEDFDQPTFMDTKQEKYCELEDIKRARTRHQEDSVTVQAAYSSEKLVRQTELASLSNRKLDVEDAYLFSPTELKEIALREARENELADLARHRNMSETEDNSTLLRERQLKADRLRELAEVANRKPEPENISSSALKEQKIKETRKNELCELSQRQSGEETNSFSVAIEKERRLKEERSIELMALADRKLDIELVTTSRAEQLRQERCEELKEIARLRGTSLSQDASGTEEDREEGTGTPELGTEEMRGRVRSTAAIWQERERSAGREGERSTCTTPTRRIGSMFKRDPDYWGREEEEELPAPPSELVNPPPPPRQSSKGRVKEYRHWTGNWKPTSTRQTIH